MSSNAFFADFVKNRILAATLTYRGSSKEVFFRPLTAAERAELTRGQKIRLNSESASGERPESKVVEVDAHDIIIRTHKFLAFCCVDERGKQVFKNHTAVGELPEDFVQALQTLANETLQDDDPGDLGNSSTENQK